MRTTPATSVATSTPPCSATPTWAPARAGASLIPSPTIAKRAPPDWSLSTAAALSAGDIPAPMRPGSMPQADAASETARMLSPLNRCTDSPIDFSMETAAALSALRRSAKHISPMMPLPSQPTYTCVSAELLGPRASPPASAPLPVCSCTHSKVPTETLVPSTIAVTPQPGTVTLLLAPAGQMPSLSAAARTASAMGWFVLASTAAASAKT
mmetsp:Transcript_27949/g.66392  ORF Transcript_27949/g.66392 Transcript_27949/m.66392 type:complete len:211 (+) Transcript_27949:269-901(+)